MKHTPTKTFVRRSKTARVAVSVQGAFTLIETLVAVVIFTTSLATLLLIAGRGVAGSTSARQDLAARMLAMEGIEVARNIRDSNYIAGVAWDQRLVPDCQGGCDVDYSIASPASGPGLDAASAGQPLWLQNTFPVSTAAYSGVTNDAQETSFRRTITVTPTGQDEIFVESVVTWQAAGRVRTVRYETYLTQWYVQAPVVPLTP